MNGRYVHLMLKRKCGSLYTSPHQCTNKHAEIVSHYNLKQPEEPPYFTSSGCMLTVLEDFGHLCVGEF